MARIPDMDLGDTANAFRQEVRAWIAANWDGVLPGPATLPENHRRASKDFSRKLAAQGWLSLTWPERWGGAARSTLEKLVLEEELAYAGAPVTWHNVSSNMIGPALIEHGTAEQCAAFLPGIASGEVCFALGYSEPESGSDLASLRTSARQTENGWVINGQKIYTSHAGFATHVWLAARTNPERPRQSGISLFLLPMRHPGITIQPMMGLNGHDSNVVFFENVEVPGEALVGEVDGGWKIITSALNHERTTLAAIAARARAHLDRLIEEVETRGMAMEPRVRDAIGQLVAEVDAARLIALHSATLAAKGPLPMYRAAIQKVYSSELMERLSETALDLLGPGAALKAGSASSIADGRFEHSIRDALLYTIGGGTNEIQRTIIAIDGLGLPR